MRGGAAGVLCQSANGFDGLRVTTIVVPDTQSALSEWAGHVIHKRQLDVVGITGSTGKTSTREAIAAVLGTRYRVFRNPANFNGRFGLPIALGQLGPEHEVAVLEMACDSFGEIAHLARLTKPRIGVVTAVNRAHLAIFDTQDAIAIEKGRLVESLPREGTAILNYDDPRVWAMRERTEADIITYGLSPDADIVASDVRFDPEGLQFQVHFAGVHGMGLRGYPAKAEVRTRLIGRHHVHTVLAAIAVGLCYNISWDDMADALDDLAPYRGRLNPLEGIAGTVLLDDSFSANPASMLAALQTLKEFPGKRRIAVLGGMSGLGGYAVEAHRQAAEALVDFTDLLVTLGERGAWIGKAGLEMGMPVDRVAMAYTSADAVRCLRERLQPGDVVLAKGDVDVRVERVVRELLADRERDSSMLVRQESGWERVRVARPERPTWVEVDLEAISFNVRRTCEVVGPDVKLLVVLKADAYGHGAVRVAHTAVNNGAAYCGVASLNEAVRLRESGIDAPILILGYTPAWQAREALRYGITITLYDPDVARAFSRAAGDLRRVAHAHVKVDTGMGRLGLLPDQVLPFVQQIRELPNLDLEGIFTHFSVADDEDLAYTREQLTRFQRVVDDFDAVGVHFRLIHCANSAALLRLPETRFNMVRLGLAMYGLQPSPSVSLPEGFQPALTWKTTVAQVKTLPRGSFISYGNTYQTNGEEQIAVIPVGYADGFRRTPRHWREVLVKGQRAPLVGQVCMDQTMIGVSHIPNVRVGDEVVLIGRQGRDRITAEQVAEWLGTINYEVVSEILARVPRVV